MTSSSLCCLRATVAFEWSARFRSRPKQLSTDIPSQLKYSFFRFGGHTQSCPEPTTLRASGLNYSIFYTDLSTGRRCCGNGGGGGGRFMTKNCSIWSWRCAFSLLSISAPDHLDQLICNGTFRLHPTSHALFFFVCLFPKRPSKAAVISENSTWHLATICQAQANSAHLPGCNTQSHPRHQSSCFVPAKAQVACHSVAFTISQSVIPSIPLLIILSPVHLFSCRCW